MILMANDTGKVILEYFLKLIIYAIGGTIGVFIFIEDYSKIEGVKSFLLAIAAFLFFLFYLLPKSKTNKIRFQLLSIIGIIVIFIIIFGSTVYENLNILYKNTNLFFINVAKFVFINLVLLKFLDKIFEYIERYVESK